MHINTKTPRSLLKDSQGKMTTTPSDFVSASRVDVRTKSNTVGTPLISIPKSQRTNNPIGQETAGSQTGSASSSIGPMDLYAPLLAGYMETEGGKDKQGNQQGVDTGLYQIYRDIHDFDPVSGNAVDMMSNMPFSDFSLSGAKDQKFLAPYEESIDNIRIRSLFPSMSAEYLVHGLFCSTTIFDDEERRYVGLIPQNVDYVDVIPLPIWGRDPLIQLRIGSSLSQLKDSKDERVQEMLKTLPEEYRSKKGAKDVHVPDPKDVIYIPRGGLLRDTRGVSIYQRILPIWLMEKAMYRGTLDQTMKRQRSVTHLQLGDEEWMPTTEEMQAIAKLLLEADMDPVGAIFVTRNGVNVGEVRSPNDMWKVSDMTDFFTQVKLRSLGISDSFITGDATYNSLEQVMSVFVEQMRAYRDRITSEIFYERMFPRISESMGYTNKSQGLSIEVARANPNQLRLDLGDSPIPTSFVELASERSNYGQISYRNRQLLIPQLQWHKRLRPEADDAYLTMLGSLSERGVPIPVRLWAAAGGLDLQSILNQKDEDIKIRDRVEDWLKAIGKSQAAVQPPMDGGGDMGGGAPGGGSDEFASALTASNLMRPRSILGRSYDTDAYDVQNRTSDGKRHLLSSKGKKHLDEQMNKKIASVASSLNAKVNAMEKKMDDNFRDMNATMKHYFMGT